MKIIINFLTSLAIMISLTIQPAMSNGNTLVERKSQEEIIFVGTITPSSVRSFFKLIESEPVLPTDIIISSGGGDAESAITLANWIRENNISITIENACISSCANYIVPAASQTLVRKGAIIGWHGGALQSTWDVDADILTSKKQQDRFILGLKKWCQNESEFFEKLASKQEILIIGHLDHHTANREHFAWTYMLADLERMGWDNIILEGDDELQSRNERLGIHLDVISLSEIDYDLELNCEVTLENINFVPHSD